MTDDNPTIHSACRNGDLEAVKRFVAADPAIVNADDEHDWRPVFHAALRRHTEVVRFLIDSGADVGAHDGYAIHYGGEVPDNKPIVKMLVEYGALDAHTLPQSDTMRQFLAAVFLANEARVRSMLRLHADLATTLDGRGDFPLHHAARNGDTAIVELLIEHGADIHATNERNHTVLYCAGGHGHVETVRVLLASGADPSVKFTHDEKTLAEWLAQYPDDERLIGVAKLLQDVA